MGLLQAVSSSESSLEINGRLIAKNGFWSLITCLYHTIVSFSFSLIYFSGIKYILARQILHFSPKMRHNARQSDNNTKSPQL